MTNEIADKMADDVGVAANSADSSFAPSSSVLMPARIVMANFATSNEHPRPDNAKVLSSHKKKQPAHTPFATGVASPGARKVSLHDVHVPVAERPLYGVHESVLQNEAHHGLGEEACGVPGTPT